ncbi:MAG: permease prefix domain 1-containing protein [Acidobacteriota bacterium]|nr:permease prefix domain 1-containing protein [Acidobacteriota bacterium]
MNLYDLFLRFRAIFQRNQVEDELDEELQAHLELQIRKHVTAGMSIQEALTKARHDFGAVDLAKEQCGTHVA